MRKSIFACGPLKSPHVKMGKRFHSNLAQVLRYKVAEWNYEIGDKQYRLGIRENRWDREEQEKLIEAAAISFLQNDQSLLGLNRLAFVLLGCLLLWHVSWTKSIPPAAHPAHHIHDAIAIYICWDTCITWSVVL